MVKIRAANNFIDRFKRLAEGVPAVAAGRQSPQGLLEKYSQAKAALGQKARRRNCKEEMSCKNEVLARRFRLEALIAETQMSHVYRATDLINGQAVAVKRALDDEVADHIDHEIEMLLRLNHPNVAGLIAAGTDWLVEEFLPKALLVHLDLSPEEALSAGYDILDVMRYAHRQKIVLRDMKPDNIMVTPAGEIKMFDFGLAKDLNKANDFGLRREFFGTPEYASPEIINNGSFWAKPAADYFALGVTLYVSVVGDFPMTRCIMGNGKRATVVYPENGPVLNESNLGLVPQSLGPLLNGLLQKDPAQRLADPEQAQQIILEALAQLNPAAD